MITLERNYVETSAKRQRLRFKAELSVDESDLTETRKSGPLASRGDVVDSPMLTAAPIDIYECIHAQLGQVDRAHLRGVSHRTRELDSMLTTAARVTDRSFLPRLLAQFPRLYHLDVADWRPLQPSDLRALQQARKLKTLRLRIGSKQAFASALKYASHATALDLRHCISSLGGADFARIGEFTQLQEVALRVRSSLKLEELLRHVPHATAIDVHFSRPLLCNDLKEIARFKNLRELRITSPLGTDENLFAPIKSLPQLARISIDAGANGTDKTLRDLTSIPQLRRLDFAAIRDNLISKAALAQIAHLTNLEHLELRFNHRYRSDDHFSFLASMQQLRTLKMPTQISDADVHALAQVPALTELDVSGALGLTGRGIRKISSIRALRHLEITFFRSADPEAFRSLAALRKLEVLKFHQSYALSNELLSYYSQLPELREIALHHCYILDDGGLEQLRALSNLQELIVNHCPRVRLFGLRDFRQLERLYVEHCGQIDDASLSTLLTVPRLRTLVFTGKIPVDSYFARRIMEQLGGSFRWE